MATVESNMKDIAHRLIERLPPGATWADLMYLIYVQQQIEEGIHDCDEGRVVAMEDIRAEFEIDE
jgi:hypothetical protein